MDIKENSYSRYALVREMTDTVDVVRKFDPAVTVEVAALIKDIGKLMLSGEGSSRIFPAKNTIRKNLTTGLGLQIATEGSRQAAQYNLGDYAVFCASNSGKTAEVVNLARKLTQQGNDNRFALTANKGTVLEESCNRTFVLNCGWEQAVAATKSVVEQALFYESILWNISGTDAKSKLTQLPERLDTALTMPIDRAIIEKACSAGTIYFAGYNDGVAEELTLKTNEITRKKSDFLEGTYAVHGIEEVMDPSDIVFIVDPIDEEIGKFQDVLEKGVGLTVVAIADRDTGFTTIKTPSAGDLNPYVYLAAGWNLLVEIGLALDIDLDKPQRARKVGNEFTG